MRLLPPSVTDNHAVPLGVATATIKPSRKKLIMSATVSFDVYRQELVRNTDDKGLKALLAIADLAPFAQAEIDFRIANADVIKAETLANAQAYLTAYGFDITDAVSLATAYVRIKGGALAFYGIEKENMPAPLAQLRDSLYVVANALGMPAEANARKAWLLTA